MKAIWPWIINKIIQWLWSRYPYLLMDVVIPGNAHIHRNPVKRKVPELYPASEK